jgi:hypothetical protein
VPAPRLDREEYVEQAYFFRVYRERIEENLPAQEILTNVREELLATTKLPFAVDFLSGEAQLHGRIGDGMAKLPHYFAPFQTFVMQRAELEEAKFETRMALRILEREAEYLAGEPIPQALFVYQFECIARNQLGYDRGLEAIAEDGMYDADWREWILWAKRQLGSVDFADLVYARSQHAVDEIRRRTHDPEFEPAGRVLFGAQEGRIAKAHRGKDPLFLFAALQRHLGYPGVPRPAPPRTKPLFEPQVEFRFQRLENRLALLESEARGGLDLSKFYEKWKEES